VHVGIVGGGQLGRMLSLAGTSLGIDCTTLDPAPRSSASQVGPSIVGGFDDREALARLADGADVVTYEFENVPVSSARFLAELVPVLPQPEALEVAQDRVAEKVLFGEIGLPTAEHRAVGALQDLLAAIEQIGTPTVLKTRRLGYDGKGQAVIRDPLLAEDAWRSIGELPAIVEGLVAFDRELSIIAVRGRDGSMVCYPLVENRHRDGILRLSIAPAPDVTAELQGKAEAYIRAAMDRLEYAGVMAIELFQVGGELLGNEMAPRVHNSGHWTIEGAETSQFENHLRAVCGMPLGSCSPRGSSAMVNLIGSQPDPTAVMRVPGAHLHLYGKEPRPGRKVGHVTLTSERGGRPDLGALAAAGVQLEVP
jgi:5-(carboxyamino)imidazole ribonucleotide synthase